MSDFKPSDYVYEPCDNCLCDTCENAFDFCDCYLGECDCETCGIVDSCPSYIKGENN
jgi:hypothetical protein